MPIQKIEFEAIGTSWEIEFEHPKNSSFDSIKKKILSIVAEFDATYSRFKTGSLIDKISKIKGEYLLPQNAKELFDLYQNLYKLTGGLFTPFIGSVLNDAGYDKNYTFKEKELKKPLKWENYLIYDYPYLTVKIPTIIDFGACGKGYLINIVADILLHKKVKSYCINAGGDIFCNNFPTKIGLENPNDFTQVIGVIEINNMAIASSSGNRRKWGKYHHILNPQTLKSPDEILATWVIAKNALHADAIATALFFTKPDQLNKKYRFEYLILYPDFTIDKSLHFDAKLFYDKNAEKI